MTETHMAECMKALADPNRISIMRMLLEGEMTVGEMQRHLRVTQPTLSHHLKLLVSMGLLENRREGLCRVYRINTAIIRTMGEYFVACADYGDQRRSGLAVEIPAMPLPMERLHELYNSRKAAR